MIKFRDEVNSSNLTENNINLQIIGIDEIYYNWTLTKINENLYQIKFMFTAEIIRK